MQITEIRVQLLDRPLDKSRDRLRAFVRITVEDALAVRDIKIIDGTQGLFVAMPSRRLQDRCVRCPGRNPVGARYCSSCGQRLPREDTSSGARRYADVCHPIDQTSRDSLEGAILSAYHEEVERAARPGYQPVLLDDDDRDVLA